MLNSIIEVIIQFRWFIIAAVIATIVMWLLIIASTPKFEFSRKTRRLYALFVGLSNKEILWAVVAFNWLVYTIVLLFPGQNLSAEYMIPFVILIIFRLCIKPNGKTLLVDLLNGALTYGAVFVISTMGEYVFGVHFEWLILVIYILFFITLLNYAVYNFVKDLLTMTKERSRQYD